MRESTDFSARMEELDRKALLMFPKASFITIGRWLEWGEFLTNALKTSSTVAPQMKSELAVIERDLANASTWRPPRVIMSQSRVKITPADMDWRPKR